MRRWSAVSAAAAVALVATQASAQPIRLNAFLTGANEFPSNGSMGTGFTTVTYDPTAHSLRVQANFANLMGTTSASHIHCCVATPFDITQTAGVATQVPTFVGFPLGVTAGTYDNTFDLTQASSWNGAFITANGGTPTSAEAAFSAGLLSGRSYLNIHTSAVPGGEIRGFLAVVPEPSTYALMATGLAGVGMAAWRRRRA